jgi:hypothetical protein
MAFTASIAPTGTVISKGLLQDEATTFVSNTVFTSHMAVAFKGAVHLLIPVWSIMQKL